MKALSKIIKVDYLSRVEGEGGLVIEIKDDRTVRLRVNIFEAPRFFESFLRGRPYFDVMDFTARICGICPVAYQMSSVHAIEKIFNIEVEKPIKELRRLLYCGEWIESHALHIYLLNGPDFYNIESAWSSKEYLTIAKKGLYFKKLGNEILTILGGRSVHPISIRVGGFYKMPDKKSLSALLPELKKAYEESLKEIKWVAGLQFNDNSWDTEYVSLIHDNEYPMNYGNVASNKGLNMPMEKFIENVQEYQVNYSTALHSGLKRDSYVSPYVVGPLSRLNLNYEKLPAEIQNMIKEAGISLPITNTHMSIIARSVELAYAFYEAIRIINEYNEYDRSFIDSELKEGEAVWITEAPRGILIHRYELDNSGYVKNCTIIPPTSQNFAHIEADIYRFVQNNIDKPEDFIKKESEKIIRSYDPCISCSVHVVKTRNC
ncbi:Ni/Fe hydrogenase subunit alpha [Dissulfurispira thermophila]|uniref:Ni/Fe hydrogenase subunit alpha n=1 Tax=Dissulfurispira thermophila TaxID=2715679 RepID=A0A7G1GZ77_9BACT|nr:Ni/Fe hydrogenase subunit alpha [Dissulfurispira thermophila]